MNKFKRGDVVLRVSGRGGYPKEMTILDSAEVAKNQEYEGLVELKEYPGSHDPNNLINIKVLNHRFTKGQWSSIISVLLNEGLTTKQKIQILSDSAKKKVKKINKIESDLTELSQVVHEKRVRK